MRDAENEYMEAILMHAGKFVKNEEASIAIAL